jgi:hypothetical protein
MQDVETAMSMGRSVFVGKLLREAEHLLKLTWDQDRNASCQVALKLSKSRARVGSGYPFTGISGVPPCLKSKGLAESVSQKSGDVKGFAHGRPMRGSKGGVGLLHVNCAEKTCVRVGPHERSPRLSAIPWPMSDESYDDWAKVRSKRAMMSGILNFRGGWAPAGESLAITFPDLVISTDSPSWIHAAIRGK